MAFKYLLVAIVAAAIAIFALQNSAPTAVRFLFWKLETVPLAVIILFSAGLGLIVVGLPLLIDRWRLRRRVRVLEARLETVEERPAEESRPPEAPWSR